MRRTPDDQDPPPRHLRPRAPRRRRLARHVRSRALLVAAVGLAVALPGGATIGGTVMSAISAGDGAGPGTTVDAPLPDEVDIAAFEDPALLEAVPVGPEPVAEPVRAVLSSAAVVDRLGRSGIPEVALRAYTDAADARAGSDPACGLRWTLLAAIGRVESNHGRFGGARLRADGDGTRAIRGIPLDGRPGVALIRDTDGGELDGDTTFDRAVGPMQFIPSTWASVAVDGNGDGRRDPNNIIDAAHGAAAYLCGGGGDLRSPEARARAVRRYNNADEYVRVVLRLAAAYETGQVTGLPSPPDGPTTPSGPDAPRSRPGTPRAPATPPPTRPPRPATPPPPATPSAPAPAAPTSPPAPAPSPDTPDAPPPTTGAPAEPTDPAAVGWAPAMREVVVAVLDSEGDAPEAATGSTEPVGPAERAEPDAPAGPAPEPTPAPTETPTPPTADAEPRGPADATAAPPASAAAAPPEAAAPADDPDAACPAPPPPSETPTGP